MKHTITLLITIILVCCLFYIHSANPKPSDVPEQNLHETEPESLPKKKLKIYVVESDNPDYFRIFAPDTLNHNMTYPLIYSELTDVSIDIEGNIIKLENAIRDNAISISEIFNYARMDAAAGFCNERFETNNGLTSFFYDYADFVIKLVYDVYETPDGNQYLINDMQLYKHGAEIPRIYADESGNFLDRENWGISFETESVTPLGITLKCKQTGGQQIGNLQTESFYIVKKEGKPKRLASNNEDYPHIIIPQDCESRIVLDWSLTHGELPKGEYTLYLSLEDIYNEQDVHPLMQNFHDLQYYSINFSIA